MHLTFKKEEILIKIYQILIKDVFRKDVKEVKES